MASISRLGALIGAASILVAGVISLAHTPAIAHPTVDIAVSNWKFVPAKITIPAGEATTLRLTATQGVHGIQSADLGIPQTAIPNGKTVLVTFTPAKPGTYIVHCSIYCGAGHPDMALTIVVTGP
jgi:cytochrome c oxidase subunit II